MWNVSARKPRSILADDRPCCAMGEDWLYSPELSCAANARRVWRGPSGPPSGARTALKGPCYMSRATEGPCHRSHASEF